MEWPLRILSVILEYGMLFWLLYFLGRIAKILRDDLNRIDTNRSHEAILTCVEGDAAFLGRRFAFTDSINIGRGDGNDIVITEQFVSRRHASIRLRNNLYVVENLNNDNHTYLNDRELKGKAYVKSGDCLRIGTLVFEFSLLSSE